MRNSVRTLREHDPGLLHKLALIEQGYLAVVAVIALGVLVARFAPSLGHLLPVDWMAEAPESAIAALISAAALEFSRPRHAEGMRRAGVALAVVLALLAGAELAEDLLHLPVGIERATAVLGAAGQPRMPALTAAAFLALAGVVIFASIGKDLTSHAADLFVSVLCLLVLILVRGYLFEGFANVSTTSKTSLLTLLTLALLAFVAFMHRAEVGVFATLVGEGGGSRIARIAAPIVLLVPFLPQSALAHAVKSGRVSTEYVSGLVAFLAAAITLTLLLYMAWKINQLESKIRDLALRDDDTGLLNRRGFHLVAWQALRHARRDGLPFSIMLIELENLTEVCDSLGKQAGYEMLVEMSEVLQAAFRATDVMGRVDPSQFSLAGHFDEKASTIMRLRLQEAVNYRNYNPGRTFSLRISSRCIHAKDVRRETLEELLAMADDSRDRELQGVRPPGQFDGR